MRQEKLINLFINYMMTQDIKFISSCLNTNSSEVLDFSTWLLD